MTSYPQVTCFFDLHLDRIVWNLYIFEYVMSDMWLLNPAKVWTVCETAERQMSWFPARFVVVAIFAKRKIIIFVIEMYYRRSSDIQLGRVAHHKNKLIPFQGDVSWTAANMNCSKNWRSWCIFCPVMLVTRWLRTKTTLWPPNSHTSSYMYIWSSERNFEEQVFSCFHQKTWL